MRLSRRVPASHPDQAGERGWFEVRRCRDPGDDGIQSKLWSRHGLGEAEAMPSWGQSLARGWTGRVSVRKGGAKGKCGLARKPRGGHRGPHPKWIASMGFVGQDRTCWRPLQVRAAAPQGPRGEELGQGHSPAILVLLMEQGCWVGNQDMKATVGVCTPAMRGLPELSSGGP